jgi:putative spermidine/putrescine transport system permease protein
MSTSSPADRQLNHAIALRRKPAAQKRRFAGFWRGFFCVAPLTIYLIVFLIIPVVKLLSASFMPHGAFGFDNYIRIASVPVYARVLGITFNIAIWTTLFAVIGGYPLAYYVTIVAPKARESLLFWIALPFWTSFLVRTFAWIVLLGRHGVLNQLFDALGMAGAPYKLLYTFASVLIGMAHALMPLAILTMMSVMRNIDQKLVPAASTLGASRARAFLTVYLPLSVPGVAAASILVFVTSLGFFVTPALMGSRHEVMLTQLVIDQVLQTLNWSFAGALSLVLLVAVLALFFIYDRVVGLDTLTGGASRTTTAGLKAAIGTMRRVAYGLLHGLADAIEWVTDAVARLRPEHAKSARRRRKMPILPVYTICVLVFLLGPSLLMIPESFTAVSSIDWPPHGFSLKWYQAIGQDPTWMTALTRSLIIGVFAAAGSMLLGVPAAFFISRSTSRWRKPLLVFSLLPLIVPHIIYAVGLFYFLSTMGLVGSILGMVIGHTAITIPYVVVTVVAILKHYDRRLDAAAQSLGANLWQTLSRITFPVLASGMISAFLFSFVTSFDELTIALFMTSGLSSTLPKLFWDQVSLSISPVIAAVSTGLLLLSIVIIWLSNRLKKAPV